VETFVVALWQRIGDAIQWLSPQTLLGRIVPFFRAYWVVDAWVIVHAVLAVIALLIVEPAGKTGRAMNWFVVYGIIRLLEIVHHQAATVFFDPFRHPGGLREYAVRSYRRMLLLTLHNYSEIVFWFAAGYRYWSAAFDDESVVATPLGALYYSTVTMTTLGYGDVVPVNDIGRALVVLQLGVTVFMTLVILGRFVSYLPIPKTLDHTERRPPEGPPRIIT
jgi:hypothetical protein